MDNKEKIIQKIKKCLELSKNNSNEHEAVSAAAQAQKLLEKYHITMIELGQDSDTEEEIIDNRVKVPSGNKWKNYLASIIADNFRCKIFSTSDYDGEYIVFYGYDTDTKIASETYEMLYKIATKEASRIARQEKQKYGTTRGVKNSYYLGFCDGVKSVLEKQCTSLVLVVPETVKESFKDRTKGFVTSTVSITARGNGDSMSRAKQSGFYDGKASMNRGITQS